MADSSVMVAVPKGIWMHFRPAADARGILPSRMMLELLRKVAEDDLVTAVMDDIEPEEVEVQPEPLPEPASAPVRAAPPKIVVAAVPVTRPASEPAPLPLPRTTTRRVRKEETILPREVPGLDIPFHLRRRNLDAAIALLKRHCILVFPANRDADIIRYRVSGYRDSQLAEQVIWIAMGYGFEVIDA